VGNENPVCHHIIVCGLLFQISSLVQAFGRLRPEQRGPDSTVTVVLKRDDTRNFARLKEDDEDRYRLLFDAGIIGEDSDNMVRQVYGVDNLQQVMAETDDCLLRLISQRFGYDRNVCRRCCNCKQRNPVLTIASKRSVSAVPALTSRIAACKAMDELACSCVCGSKVCNGATCLSRIGIYCFRCGGPHQVKSCNFDVDAILKGGACSKCWDLYSRVGIHKHSECRIQYRLRTVLLRFVRYEKPDGGLKRLMEKMMVSDEAWFRSVCRMYGGK
jgi:hypothetical protein